MSETTTNLYEGLFLINPTPIQSSLATATKLVQEVLDRSHAEVLSISKWDERKLAYTIRGAKRGIYILAYFKVDGKKVASIERDVNLSENLVRCLILRADHVGEVELQAALEAQKTTQAAAKLQAEKPAEPPPEAAAPAAQPIPAAAPTATATA